MLSSLVMQSHDIVKVSRLIKKPIDETGCWIWLGPVRADGYGHIRVDGKYRLARRLVVEIYVDEKVLKQIGYAPKIPLFSRCLNRLCVNPKHMTTNRDVLLTRSPIAREKVSTIREVESELVRLSEEIKHGETSAGGYEAGSDGVGRQSGGS